MNSHMEKTLCLNENLPYSDGKKVDILQMGPVFEMYLLQVRGNYRREIKARHYLKDQFLAVLLSVYLLAG